jgi:hypothetical protein
MQMVDDILKTLEQAARAVKMGVTPEEVVESYSEVTALIQNILSQEYERSAREAYEVFVERQEDPAIWEEPVMGVALNTLNAERIDEIYNATYILASRLPGTTPIRRKRPPRPGVRTRTSRHDRRFAEDSAPAEATETEAVSAQAQDSDEDDDKALA